MGIPAVLLLFDTIHSLRSASVVQQLAHREQLTKHILCDSMAVVDFSSTSKPGLGFQVGLRMSALGNPCKGPENQHVNPTKSSKENTFCAFCKIGKFQVFGVFCTSFLLHPRHLALGCNPPPPPRPQILRRRCKTIFLQLWCSPICIGLCSGSEWLLESQNHHGRVGINVTL